MLDKCTVILYFDLAAATHNGWVSAITPLPIGVGRKGRLELTTNCCISSSACAYAAPTNKQKKKTMGAVVQCCFSMGFPYDFAFRFIGLAEFSFNYSSSTSVKFVLSTT